MKKEKIYQTKFTNSLLVFDTKEKEFETVKTAYGYEREYKVDDDLYVMASVAPNYEGKYTIDDFQFSTTAKRLLVFLIMKFTNLSQDEREIGEIEFTVKEFAELCGLKDRDNCKRLIEKDLFNLMCVRCEYQCQEIFLIEDFGIGRGRFVVILHEAFARHLTSYKGVMLIPYDYFSISLNRCSEAPGWLYFLCYQAHINRAKTNKNRISVNSLLNRASLMGLDEIRHTSNCSVKERVILPLLNNLKALHEMCDFNYFNKAGKELTEKQIQNLSYEELIKVVIHFEIK